MRKLIASLALGAGLFLAIPASAQMAPDVNCAALTRSPYMCVKNAAAMPIVALQAFSPGMSYNPNAWIRIPGGPISPGGTSIVQFPAFQGCNYNVIIQTASGQTHTYPNVDVCNSTSFVVRGW